MNAVTTNEPQRRIADMTTAERNRQTAVLIWSSLVVVTVLLLSRRVAGGIVGVTSVWPCLLVSLLATLFSGLGWISFQQQPSSRPLRTQQIAVVLAWLPTWLSGIALLPSESPLACGWLFGIAALSGAGLTLSMKTSWTGNPTGVTRPEAHRRACESSTPFDDSGRVTPSSATTTVAPEPSKTAPAPADLAVFDPVNDERSTESTTQWMTRQSLPDGVDQIEGAIRVSFAAGQRAASVHVPFSPPFAAVPQVECETIGDDSARWKVSVVYAFGMRVELKRESSDEPSEIELSYSAVCQSAAEAA
jgi:hypothetical protein